MVFQKNLFFQVRMLLSLGVQSFGAGELPGAAAQLVEDDQRVEDVALHEEQPHVELLEPHHVSRV